MNQKKEHVVKKQYEKPRIVAIEDLGGRTGPCTRTQAQASCSVGVFS